MAESEEPRAPPAPTPAGAPPPPTPVEPGRQLLRIALPFYGIVALFAFGFALFSGGLGGLLGERPPTPPGLLAAVGLGLALVLLTRVGSRAWSPMGRMVDRLAELIGPIGIHHAVALAVLSGCAEELLFRGALWPHLDLLGTTLLFGLVHVLPMRSLWVYPLFALFAGLLLGLLRAGTLSVWPPMLAHVTVNAINLAWLGARARRVEPPEA